MALLALSILFSGCVIKNYEERPYPKLNMYQADTIFDVYVDENATHALIERDEFMEFMYQVSDMKKAYLKFWYQTEEYNKLREKMNNE